MSEEREPRVIEETYEVGVVETPPPSPPEYELLYSWPTPTRPPKPNRRSSIPIVIASIALVLSILSLSIIASPAIRQLFTGMSVISMTTTTVTKPFVIAVETTTLITTSTTISTKVTMSTVLITANIEKLELRFTPTKTGKSLTLNITLDEKPSDTITKENFKVNYWYSNDTMKTVEKKDINVTSENEEPQKYTLNATLPIDSVKVETCFLYGERSLCLIIYSE